MPNHEPSDKLRPLLGAGICFLLYRVALYFLVPIGQELGGQMVGLTVPELLAAGLSTAITLGIFEARGLGDVGLNWIDGSAWNLFTGILLGAGGAVLAVIPAVLTGHAHFARVESADVSALGAAFMPVLLFCGAMGEEIAFRGFALQYLMRGYGRWAALLGMGALFGVLHLGNPGATTLGTVNTAGFGVLFGIALLRSHDLWYPAGMHLGWNATLPFLGSGLSGITIRVTRYELVWDSGNLWSGGQYGPEASLVTTFVMVALLIVVWKLRVRRGNAFLLEEPAPLSS